VDASRFGYSGPILEDEDLGALLARAHERGYRRCLVQSYGHVLNEVWTSDGGGGDGGFDPLERWLPGRGLAAAGRLLPDGTPDPGFLLVDLERWHGLGRPDLLSPGEPVAPLPAAAEGAGAHLRPEDPAAAAALRRYLDEGLAGFDPEAPSPFDPAARGFLERVRRLTTSLRRGVFVWNLESYADVEDPPPGFRGPLDCLYSVAAGLKPNRILETHGFDTRTRVVFFDYSEPGLRFRRLLLETWDGRDYPSFVRRLFTSLPPEEAFYLLWEGTTPETVDWDRMEARWRQELDAWGGASVLARHWTRYRGLRHELVHCDLLAERGPLLARLEDRPSAAIWWSNAFFSFVSNWAHPAPERREIYRGFLDELAERAPGLFLYGASSDNVAVNGVRAAPYRDWYRRHGGDELEPGKLHRRELRF
jgi:hypothetical protein